MSLTFVTILTIFFSFGRLSYTGKYEASVKVNDSFENTTHKLYLSLYGDPLAEFAIETTLRPSHQIISNILLELLVNQLNYQNVTLRYNDKQSTQGIMRSFDPRHEKYPKAMVNLEVWQPPGFRVDDFMEKSYITDAGPLGPVVTPGFFIPRTMVQKFWDSDKITIDHWRVFKKKSVASLFQSSLNGKGYDTVMCSSKSNCAQLLFVNTEKHIISPVIEYINASRLFMTPFVMKNSSAIERLLELLSKSPPEKLRPPVLYSWHPNIVTMKHGLVRVVTSCDGVESFSDASCKDLQLNHIRKWVWKNISEAAPNAYALISNFTFTQKQYEDLLLKAMSVSEHISVESKKLMYSQIAKEWIENNQHVWKKWLPDMPAKKEITIAGLLPTWGSRKIDKIVSFGIAVVDFVNENELKAYPYKLKLEVHNVSADDEGSILYAYNQVIFNCVKSRILAGIMMSTWSDVTLPVAELSNRYPIPIISPTVSAINTASSNSKFRHFFRTFADHSDYPKYLTSFFLKHKWKRFALFHQNKELEKKDFKHIEVVRDFERKEKDLTMEFVNKALALANRDRLKIFVVDYPLDGTSLILCAAVKMKMTAVQGYVWVLGQWLAGSTNFKRVTQAIQRHGCTEEEANSSLVTFFVLSCHPYDKYDLDTFRKLTLRLFGTQSKYNWDPYARLVFYYTINAMLTFAKALKILIGNGSSGIERYLADKQRFLDIISSIDFKGTLGRVKFTKDNVPSLVEWRLFVTSTTEIYHFTRGWYRWDPKNDSDEEIPTPIELVKFKFAWFPDRKAPTDGSIVKCDWLYFGSHGDKSCEFRKNVSVGIIVMSSIVGIVMVILVIYCSIRSYIRMVNARYPQPFAELQEALSDYEIPRAALLLQYPLGQGAFGTVYYGEMKTGGAWTGIAAKVLREGASSQERREFLCEAIKMRDFKHSNVMTIIGVVTTESLYVNVMEFMLHGDLRKYLLTRHHVAKNDPESQDIQPITLTVMALDIARGLGYLQQNKLVHRDLACRNCLVDKEYHIKISDFGMTREVDDRKTYYRFEHPGILPVRWMAPESIQSGLFNFYTDIWSYGVVLYEIVTFGNQPYRGRTNEEVIDSLKHYSDSLVSYLVKPEERIPELFELMRMCWAFKPEERPSLSYIIRRLEVNPECVRPCLDESPPDPGETHPRGQAADRCSSMFAGGDAPIGRGNRGLGGGGASTGAGGSTSFVRMMSSGSRSSCDRTRFASGNRVDTDLRHCDSVGRVNNLTSSSFTNSIASRLGFLRDNPSARWYAGGGSSSNAKPYRHTCSQEFLSYSRHHSGDQEISTVSDPHGYQVEYDPLMLNTVRSIAVNAASNAGYSGISSHSTRDCERGSSSGGQRDDDDLDTDQQTLLNTGRA